MTETKYYFPSRIIEAGTSFTVKLATKNYDLVTQDIFHQTCYAIEKDIAEMMDSPDPFRSSSLIANFENNSDEINDDVFQAVFDQVRIVNKVKNRKPSKQLKNNVISNDLIKGWMIDKIFEKDLRPLLNSPVISGISLNSGGDMKVATRKGDDFYWEIGIRNPAPSQSIIGYYLRNGSVSTAISNNETIQQVAVFNSDLVGADIWSNTGATVGMEKFSKMIWRSKLTGILFDQVRAIPFRDGILGHP